MEESMSEELRARILADVNLEEGSLKQGVQELRTWLTTIPYLPQQLEDTQLVSFLIACKTMEKAKKKIHYGYTHRRKYPQYFENRNPLVDVPPEKCMRTGFLEGLTPDGSRVFLICLPDKNSLQEFDYWTALKEVLMHSELDCYQHPVSRGNLIIVDTSNVCLALLQKVSLYACKTSISCFFEVLPGRLSGLVLFNSPALTQFAYDTFARPFMPKKLKDRVSIYRDHSKLVDHLPLEMIPQDYGGTAPSVDSIIADSRRNLEEMEDWFETFGSMNADVSKMPEEHHSCKVM